MGQTEYIGETIEVYQGENNERVYCGHVGKAFCSLAYYFQRGFNMLCGVTVGEYIRRRRLSIAGNELALGKRRIIDVALDCGYDSPDSFAKAFTRFHGVTPSAAGKGGAAVRSYAPLKIKLTLEGGYMMDYKIMKKDSFTVKGISKRFRYENAKRDIPLFWNEHFEKGLDKYVCGVYGVNIDESMGSDEFEYMIADNCDPAQELPEGVETRVIPALTWAVFPCRGAMPKALQDVNVRIFSEWLPNCAGYEFAAGYCVELYSDPREFEKGMDDENYYSEIWIPVKKK